MFIICSYIRFPLYIFAHLQIYIIRTKLRSVRSSFFKVCSKAVFAGDCLGVPLRVGLSAASPRYAVGFPLQSLTWVKGLSLSCTCTLGTGCSVPASVSDHSVRLHGRSRTSGGRTNGTHPSVPSHGASAVRRNLPCPLPSERVPRCLSGSRPYSR